MFSLDAVYLRYDIELILKFLFEKSAPWEERRREVIPNTCPGQLVPISAGKGCSSRQSDRGDAPKCKSMVLLDGFGVGFL
jgi:hypothetical protein